jgi:5-formyltetrahydrofolate cyclo-ligase
MSDKNEIRKLMRGKRAQVSSVDAALASDKLLDVLEPLLLNAKNIAIYFAAGSELNLDSVIRYCLEQGHNVFAPVATRKSKTMRFEQVFDAKPRDIFYLEDYELVSELKWYNLDLALLPLVAVDAKGYRLGQGGGYYDTTFAKRERSPILCGVGYQQQLIAEVPCEEWDLRLDYFASECQLLKFT